MWFYVAFSPIFGSISEHEEAVARSERIVFLLATADYLVSNIRIYNVTTHSAVW
jgi:hypothetical protein